MQFSISTIAMIASALASTALAVPTTKRSTCKAVFYDIGTDTIGGLGGVFKSGVKLYQNGVQFLDITHRPNGHSVDDGHRFGINSKLPNVLVVSALSTAPGKIDSCDGAYGAQSALRGKVGGSFIEFGLGAGEQGTCELDFNC